MRTQLLASLVLLGLVIGCTRAPGDADPPSGAPAPAPVAVQVSPPAPPGTSASTRTSPPNAPGATPASDTAHLALSSEGLDVVFDRGTVRHLLFEVPAAQVIEAVSRVYGSAPERGRNEECGAGPLDMAMWPNGLTVVTQHDRFVGWSASARPDRGRSRTLATMAGVGPGSTRRDLESAYVAKTQETTLGQEFEAGGLFGVLDGKAPTARIDVMWAGTSCNFR